MNLRIFLAHTWHDSGVVSISYTFTVISQWWNLSGWHLASESGRSFPPTAENRRRTGEKHWVTLLSQDLQRETAAHLHPAIIACQIRAFWVGYISYNLGKSSCLLNQGPNTPAQWVMNIHFHLLLSNAGSSTKPITVFLTLMAHSPSGSLALLLQLWRPRMVVTIWWPCARIKEVVSGAERRKSY